MNILATLIRLIIGGLLATVVFGQVGVTPVAVLTLAFLVTVVWTPLTRQHQGVS